jgi:hypothetical protein
MAKRSDNVLQVFTLERKMIDAPHDGWDGWMVDFAFHAKDESDALYKAVGWAMYQGFPREDVRVRPATSDEVEYRLHNEYLR